jgi:hypothetical protein
VHVPEAPKVIPELRGIHGRGDDHDVLELVRGILDGPKLSTLLDPIGEDDARDNRTQGLPERVLLLLEEGDRQQRLGHLERRLLQGRPDRLVPSPAAVVGWGRGASLHGDRHGIGRHPDGRREEHDEAGQSGSS